MRQGGSNEKVSCILHKGTWNDSRIIVSTKVDAVSARCPNKILLYARHFGLKTDFLHVSADLPNAQSMLVRPFRAEHRPTARKWKTKYISISPPALKSKFFAPQSLGPIPCSPFYFSLSPTKYMITWLLARSHHHHRSSILFNRCLRCPQWPLKYELVQIAQELVANQFDSLEKCQAEFKKRKNKAFPKGKTLDELKKLHERGSSKRS